MIDPDRIADGAGDDAEATLLRAARRYRISDETRKRAFAVAGLSAGASALGAGQAAAKGVATGGKWIAWVLAGVVGVAASVGGYRALAPLHRTIPPSPPSGPTQVAPQSNAPAPSAVSAQAGVREPAGPSTVENAASDTPSAPATPQPHHTSSAESRSGPPADLQAELTALDAVSKAIARGDTPRALSLLDAYGRDFSRGSLFAEATVLRAEALERSGRHTEAAQVARTFVKHYPKSPLSDRMRRIAGE